MPMRRKPPHPRVLAEAAFEALQVELEAERRRLLEEHERQWGEAQMPRLLEEYERELAAYERDRRIGGDQAVVDEMMALEAEEEKLQTGR